jgi:competence protein ComGC
MEALKEIWQFVRQRKKFWLVPMIVILILLGLLIVFGGASAMAPFIYTLF